MIKEEKVLKATIEYIENNPNNPLSIYEYETINEYIEALIVGLSDGEALGRMERNGFFSRYGCKKEKTKIELVEKMVYLLEKKDTRILRTIGDSFVKNI